MPINLPQIDVLCIGAGGGSIARVDEFGSLTVGPASAGADPGPAAYGRGGTEATVTDAHVVLGTLSASERSLAGGVPLDRELARAPPRCRRSENRSAWRPRPPPRRSCASPTPTWPTPCGVMTVARGHDPRRFALVAIGGAGPMHACALADELGIPRVVVPALPGRGRGARPAGHRHPPRPAPQLAAADGRHHPARSSDAELERLEAGGPRSCSAPRTRSATAVELDRSSWTCATGARPTT